MNDNIRTITGVPPLTVENADGLPLVDYKIYGNSEQRNLPSEYQQVEYLESTGPQYIGTGVVPYGQGFKFETKFSYDTWVAYYGIYGNYVSETADAVRLILGSTDTGKGYVTNMVKPGGFSTAIDVPKGTINTIVDAYSYAIVNGVRTTKTSFASGTTNETPVTIFRSRANVLSKNIELKIYYQKIWNNDILIRNFIPCYRKSDNVAGMYDTVDNVFYTNSGTGEFTVGADAPTPEAPIEIQSVGDLVTDQSDVNYGKYKIPVVVNNTVTNIYLDEPLRKVGDYADYIDFANQKVVRNVEVIDDTGTLPIGQSLRGLATPTEETITLPEILLEDGTNIIAVPTEVTPSNMELQYYLFVNKLYSENAVANIAKAIRAKNGTANTYIIKEMAPAIRALPSAITVNPLSVTENGTYTAPTGTAYGQVTVNVPSPTLNSLNVTTNGTYTAPTGTAYSDVDVSVPVPTLTSLTATQNTTYTAPANTAYNSVSVNVPVPTINPLSVTQNGTYTPTSGTAYGTVTVNVPGFVVPETMCFGSSTFTEFPSGVTFASRYGTNEMFADCDHLQVAPLFDTSGTYDMSLMFSYCRALRTVPAYDTGNAEDLSYMFYICESLTSVPQFDLSSALNVSNMFNGCTALTSVPQFDLSSATDAGYMFNNCSSLTTTPAFNTPNLTNTQYMFHGCSALTSVALFDTSKVTDPGAMFSGCSNLTTMPQFDFSSATVFASLLANTKMYNGCSSLSNDSLNNILASLAGATSYTGTKTLKYLGITSAQATICEGLSNFAAFTAAGWTTGY